MRSEGLHQSTQAEENVQDPDLTAIAGRDALSVSALVAPTKEKECGHCRLYKNCGDLTHFVAWQRL